MILCYFGVAVSVFAAVIFSSIVFGSMQCWFDWLGVGATPFCNHPVDDGNYSLNRLIFDWLGMDVARFLIIGLISMAALFIWLGRRKESSNGLRNSNSDSLEDFPIVGVGCLIYLLSGPLVWEHYYILTIPSVLFMLRPRYDDQSLAGRRNTIISRCLVIYSMIMLSLVSGQAFFKTDIIYSFAITIVIGTILLFILTMKELLENAL